MNTVNVKIFFAVALPVFSCVVFTSCFCVAGISEADRLVVNNILIGFDNSRMRLNSGVCRIAGQSNRGQFEIVRDDILIAFDYNEGFYRFDQGADRSLRTPDYYYEFVENSQMVTRDNRDAEGWLPAFDIRNLGFFIFLGDVHEKYYDERIEIFGEQPIAVEEVNEVFILTVSRTSTFEGVTYPPIIRRYWIDSRQGFSMVRFELYLGLDSTEKSLETMEISWKEINNTWVPTSFTLLSTQTSERWADWTIDWSLVNEKVPESYFDPTLLSDKVEMIVSLELDEPVIIGKIGKGLPLPEPLWVPEDKKTFTFNHIILWVGICLIILTLGKKVYDYWRARGF
ncbi:MAG: hypothetical protein FWG73_01385 [Planctomycetaceae bacterium]|nr:hypothetical protein [Planctomycetaceae bacterium]